MKVPLKWLSEYVKLPKSNKSLSDDLTMVGHMLDKSEIINKSLVFDLELRSNRSDCYSILGIAKEVAAIYKSKVKYPPILKLPKLDKKMPLLLVNQSAQDLVKRYIALKLSVKVKPSPKWIIDHLTEYGIPALNNVIDITNYVMVETGHPMHAFDYEKIRGGKLILRRAKKGEIFETIQQGTKFNLTEDDFVVSDKSNIQCLNIIGGFESRITDVTSEIIIESAVYDSANVRKTTQRFKTLTEGGGRHEKHQDPNGINFAMERAIYLLTKYADAKISSLTSDYYPKPVKPWKLVLDLDYLEKLSGVTISDNDVVKILKSLGFDINNQNNNKIIVIVPTFRTDVKLEEDLIEEVLRIYGYDKIPEKVLSLSIPKNITPAYILQENKIKSAATAAGFDEVITLSFVKQDLLELNNDTNAETETVELQNPPSPDTEVLRMTLLPNLYEHAQKAIYERASSAKLFEVGKVYGKWESKYIEKRKAGFIYWKDKSEFKDFKSRILGFFEALNIDMPLFYPEVNSTALKNTFNLQVKDQVIGWGGEYKQMHYLELDLDSLLNKNKKYLTNLWPKYPPQIEDITFILPERTLLGDIAYEAVKSSPDIIKFDLKGVFENSYTFNIWYQNETHTLDNKEVEELRNKILNVIKNKFGGEVK